MSNTPPTGPEQPPYQPQGHPQQGYPPQPGQPYPAQNFPAQNFPAQNFPAQNLPAQGYPQQGYPQQGYPQGQPEYLQSGGGQPFQPGPPQRKNRKPLVIGALAVGAVVLVGGGVAGAFALKGFIGAGAQPSEALPADTVGYLSVNLDPAGEQKIEALKMLNKFPAFRDEVDIDADGDIREAFFDEALNECSGVSFKDDVEPWLGNRAAIAALPGVGEAPVTPVGVIEVTDGDAAKKGIDALIDACGLGDFGGYVVAGDWAILAESEDIAADAAADAEKGTLADDGDFQKWTGEAGDSGIMSAYAAPGPGELLADTVAGMGGAEAFGGELPTEGMESWSEFGGAAATLRFADTGLELEYAADGPAYIEKFLAAGEESDVIASLPSDTALAMGSGFADGWVTALADEMARTMGEGQTGQELLDELGVQLGLELPADLEALFGDSVALGLGSDFDVDALESGDFSGFAAGVKVKGDAEAIEAVLDKLRSTDPGVGEVVVSEAGDGYVVISPSEDYRKKLLEDGGLGDSETFKDVIPAEALDGMVMYLDFDASGWLEQLAGDDAELAENLEPLAALGSSSWLDGEVSHGLLRVTTD